MASGQTFPVKPDLIALEITKQKFEDPISKIHGHSVSGIEGMLKKSADGHSWYVLYDKTIEKQGRINFTLSHELGHYLLHRNQEDSFECGQSNMLDYNSPESQKREKEANIFASYLLMPIDDFKKQIDNQSINLDLISHCADRYDVSFTAAALKWIEFTDETAIVVMARDDFICWSFPSQKAKNLGIYFSKGTPVPEDSISQLNLGSIFSNTSTLMPPGVWHPKFESVESIIVSDKYEMAIFLVRFPSAHVIEHDEDKESDSFDFLAYRAKGFGWSK
jgi:hypothetical protein